MNCVDVQKPSQVRSIVLHFSIYAILAFVLSYGFMKPGIGFDLLGYLGSALSWDIDDDARLHHEVYRLSREAVSPEVYKDLISDISADRPSTYRSTARVDPEAFIQQLPYYKIRVFYTSFIYVGHRLGINPVTVAIGISYLATLGMALILFHWLRVSYSMLWSAVLTLLLCLMMRAHTFSGIATPDALSAFTFLLFCRAIFSAKSWYYVGLFMWLSVLTRTNNILFAGPILFALTLGPWLMDRLTGKNLGVHWRLTRVTWWQFLLVAGWLLISVSILNIWADNYGWWQVFYFTFVESMNYPADFNRDFSIAIYMQVFAMSVRESLSDPFVLFMFWSLILSSVFFSLRNFKLGELFQEKIKNVERVDKLRLENKKNKLVELSAEYYLVFSVVILLCLGLHFVLFPAAWHRFFFGQYLLIHLLFLLTSASLFRSDSGC